MSRTPLGSIVLATALAAAGAIAPVARAQGCLEGRVLSEATAGRCCWPGQTWSEEHARCYGPPTCPARLVAEGDHCVRPMAATAVAPVVPALASGVTSPEGIADHELAWEPTPPALALAIRDPQIVEGTDDGLLASGLALFGAGYVAAIVVGAADEAAQNCSFSFFPVSPTGCGTWPWAFLPVVGGALAGSLSGNNGSFRTTPILGLAIGIPAAAAQAFGLVLTIIAAVRRTENVVSGDGHRERDRADEGDDEPEVDDFALTITPFGGGSEAGLWAELHF